MMHSNKEQCSYMGTALQPCGCAVVAGRSYCADHLWLVYQKGTAVNRRKDRRTAEAVWSLQDAFNEAVAELEAEGFDVWGDSERLEA